MQGYTSSSSGQEQAEAPALRIKQVLKLKFLVIVDSWGGGRGESGPMGHYPVKLIDYVCQEGAEAVGCLTCWFVSRSFLQHPAEVLGFNSSPCKFSSSSSDLKKMLLCGMNVTKCL